MRNRSWLEKRRCIRRCAHLAEIWMHQTAKPKMIIIRLWVAHVHMGQVDKLHDIVSRGHACSNPTPASTWKKIAQQHCQLQLFLCCLSHYCSHSLSAKQNRKPFNRWSSCCSFSWTNTKALWFEKCSENKRKLYSHNEAPGCQVLNSRNWGLAMFCGERRGRSDPALWTVSISLGRLEQNGLYKAEEVPKGLGGLSLATLNLFHPH